MIKIEKLVGKTVNGLAYVSPNLMGKLMLDLFCRPIKGRKFNNKEQAIIDAADWKTLYLKGKKIQCYVWGNGSKKVLLAHGFNSNASRWRLLVNQLQTADYQIIALDIPAHGNSDWNRVNGLLYAQVIEVIMEEFKPNFVVGHSFAGLAFCYYFSKMNFQPIEKIVLMGVPNELTDVSNVFFQILRLNQKVQAAYYKAFKDKFGYEVDYFTLSKMVTDIVFPALIIHDEEDDIASFEGAKILHQHWKNSSFFPTKKLGHSLQGRAVYKEVLKFLSEGNE